VFDLPHTLGYKPRFPKEYGQGIRLMTAKTFLRNLTVANQLTFLRLVAVPFFILAVLQGRFGIAVALFLGAALTDLLDGLTARLFHQGTPLGSYLDPAADKLLLTAGFVLLTDYPQMFQGIEMAARIPLWLTILTISRDVIIVAVALILYLTLHQKSFRPSIWGKLTTVGESITVACFLLFNALGSNGVLLDVLVWVTLLLTLTSGFHYLGRTIRLLGEPRTRPEDEG
jgi:cardiolipin synthase